MKGERKPYGAKTFPKDRTSRSLIQGCYYAYIYIPNTNNKLLKQETPGHTQS